jgi:phage tail P2-like protein
MTLQTLEFLRLLPVFMRGGGAARGLGAAMGRLIPPLAAYAAALSTWDAIDRLSESELDELAWELYITWYDSGADILTKRELVRSSYLVRARHGTPWAVEELLRAYFGNGEVSEWFEYGGEPFYFRIYVETDPTGGAEDRRQLFESIRRVKNVRSHLEAAYFVSETPFDPGVYPGAAAGLSFTSTELPLYWPDDDFSTAAFAGAADGSVSATALPGGTA